MSTSTRSDELDLWQVLDKYSQIPRFVIIKIDVQRRSVIYSPAALSQLDPHKHQTQINSIFGTSAGQSAIFPASLLLRDGSSILAVPREDAANPYLVDYRDGRIVLVDQDRIVEEVEYWPNHRFYDKFTSSGKPMWQIAAFSRPQRLDFNPYYQCHYWDNGKGCLYCNAGAVFHQVRRKNGISPRVDPQDIYETVREAIKDPGRYTNILLTGGSKPGSNNDYEDEVQVYIESLQAIGANFKTRRFPSQLISSSFNEDQLGRIYEQTGLSSYTSDLEVLNQEKFAWICPGKSASLGYNEWKNRLIRAVGIFGKGKVNTGIVGGVELASPHGFNTEAEGLTHTLEEAEDLAQNGVSTVACVWGPSPGSVFHKQKVPSLEYYVQLSIGLDGLRRKYELNIDFDNYRRCGNHPDTDLSRL